MGNKVSIQPVEIRNLRTATIQLGVRVYDDYAMTLDTGWDSIPDDDLELVRACFDELRHDEVFVAIMDSAQENSTGFIIGDSGYSFEEIEPAYPDPDNECPACGGQLRVVMAPNPANSQDKHLYEFKQCPECEEV